MAYLTGPRDVMVVLTLAALLLAVPHASAAELWTVDFTKQWTGHERGLKYQYTFKVTSQANGAPVNGAEFTVVGDMPDMRGHHPTQSVVAAPGSEAGTYRATLHFFMAGDWELKLDFKKPRPNELLLLDTVKVANKPD